MIAEYNPFHLGHQFHLQETRDRLGQDCAIVCVMSGNFVQRGTPALFSKHVRVETALRCGADLVLEIPLNWAMAPAERFASGAIYLLQQTNAVEYLSFGSESDHLDVLWEIAVCLEQSQDLEKRIIALLQNGVSYPTARQKAAEAVLGQEKAQWLRRPNQLLAISYLRALCRFAPEIQPIVVKRRGVAHDAERTENGFASASCLRDLISRGEWEQAKRFIPPTAAEIYESAMSNEAGPAFLKTGERAVLGRLWAMDQAAFAQLPEAGGGLSDRLYQAVQTQGSLMDILAAAKTKRYTHAHLRRQLMRAYLGITIEDYTQYPPYLRVLGCNDVGRSLLKQMRKNASLPIVTKPAHSKKLTEEGKRQFFLEVKAGNLYGLFRPRLSAPGEEWRRGPVILSNHKG